MAQNSAYNKVKVKGAPMVSNTVKEEEIQEGLEELKQVAVSKPVKKGLMERMVVGLIGPDGLPAAGRYIMKDLVGPALKELALDSLHSTVDILINRGEPSPRRNTGSTSSGGARGSRHTDYANQYNSSNSGVRSYSSVRKDYDEEDPGQVQRLHPGVILQDWVIEDRGEAQKVMDNMIDWAYRYAKVRVGDYYNSIGLKSIPTDNDFGWTYETISRSRIRSIRGGYIVELPPVQPV